MRNLRPAWVFDFSVRVPEHVVTAVQGQTIQVPVMVQLDRGQPQPVALTVATNWASVGISANILPPTVVPVGGAGGALLSITVSPNTPPGSYMIGVRGETGGTFKTSEDMVTVVVKGRDKPRKQDQQPKEQPQKPAKAASKSSKGHPPPRPSYSASTTRPPLSPRSASLRRLAGGLFMGGIIAIIIYAAYSTSFSSAGFGGGGSQTWEIYSTMGQQWATADVDGSGNFTGYGWTGYAPGIGNYAINIINGRMSGTSMTFEITASYNGTVQNIYGTASGTMDAAFPNASSASGSEYGTISDPLGDRPFTDTWTAERVS
jgi:hypothetical protein